MKKRTGKPVAPSAGGFTLIEVMVAISILAISLVAIINVQASSIHSASRVKFMTVGTLLARSKIVDIEQELMEQGFSDFAEELDGNFEEEGWPDFRWRATISKVRIPVPTSMPGQEDNPYASMLSGYSSMLTDMIANALRECIITVEWGDGGDLEELSIATHFIETGRATMLQTTVGGVGNLGSDGGSGDSGGGGNNTSSELTADPKKKRAKAVNSAQDALKKAKTRTK